MTAEWARCSSFRASTRTRIRIRLNSTAYFNNKFKVVRPVRRVNVDLSQGMLRELDERAARLNISRQAVIKTLLGRALALDHSTKGRTRIRPTT